jgi:hypothetical protein
MKTRWDITLIVDEPDLVTQDQFCPDLLADYLREKGFEVDLCRKSTRDPVTLYLKKADPEPTKTSKKNSRQDRKSP